MAEEDSVVSHLNYFDDLSPHAKISIFNAFLDSDFGADPIPTLEETNPKAQEYASTFCRLVNNNRQVQIGAFPQPWTVLQRKTLKRILETHNGFIRDNVLAHVVDANKQAWLRALLTWCTTQELPPTAQSMERNDRLASMQARLQLAEERASNAEQEAAILRVNLDDAKRRVKDKELRVAELDAMLTTASNRATEAEARATAASHNIQELVAALQLLAARYQGPLH